MESNNKRIAKNTLLLYFRMLLTMGVSLYTVRVVLNTLGVVDYGIYNVVGGVVTMFSFLSGTMATASQRFFSIELGRKNYDQLRKTFSMTMNIYVLIAVIIMILAETIGLWFLNTQMTISIERMEAANWIYQFSIMSFLMTMFTIPYNASIIAHERMNVYAYVSIIEVLLKLLIVYLLVVFSFDKLKLYAVLIFGVTTIVTFIYRTYCIRKFKECKFTFYWNKKLFKEIVNYSGWNLFGSLSGVLNDQGVNILLNVYFNPIINAARGISFQINNAVNSFATNFSMAVNPQIVKYYAQDEKQKMHELVFRSSKLSYFLLFIISIPIFVDTNFILSKWLNDLPDYVILFTQLVLIISLVDSISLPLITAALSSSKIQNYQIAVGGLKLLNLPISFLFLELGYPPQITFFITFFISIINLFVRLVFLRKMIELKMLEFVYNVILRILIVTIIVTLNLYLISGLISVNNWVRFILVSMYGILVSVFSIYFIAISSHERFRITQYIKIKLNL